MSELKQLKHFLNAFDTRKPGWQGAPEVFFNEEYEKELKENLNAPEYETYHVAKFLWDVEQVRKRRFKIK